MENYPVCKELIYYFRKICCKIRATDDRIRCIKTERHLIIRCAYFETELIICVQAGKALIKRAVLLIRVCVFIVKHIGINVKYI